MATQNVHCARGGPGRTMKQRGTKGDESIEEKGRRESKEVKTEEGTYVCRWNVNEEVEEEEEEGERGYDSKRRMTRGEREEVCHISCQCIMKIRQYLSYLREQQTSKQQASTDGRMVDGRPDQETQKRGMIHSGAQWSMEIREAGRKPGYASDDEEGLAG